MIDIIDFNSKVFATDPEQISSVLRKQKGLYPYELPNGTKAWLVTRRSDVEEVLTKNIIFQVEPATDAQSYQQNPFSEAIPKPLHLLATDGAQHQRLRGPLESFFTKKVLESYREFITAEIKSMLFNWKKEEVHDLAKELSYLVPVKVISKMLGLEWQEHFPEYAISLQLVKENPENHLKNVVSFHQIISEAIARKKGLKGNDIISVLLNADLSEEEVLSMSLLLFMAGSGTTASLISQGLYQMINKQIAPHNNLADEILSRTSPANSAFPRYSHQDYALSDTLIKKGDLLIVMLASANYDMKNGEDPLKNHLSFSKGIHHCIGWYLAKMEAKITYQIFYEFFPESQIVSEDWFINITSRDIITMNVQLG
ncbi:cytochrome P450 [Pedobacter sp. PAMC26386]|nr:cytochrome P450 [Pedobacter sp. PAMC26386]